MGFRGLLAKGAPANLPRFVLFLRIAIVGLSVVILALAAYALPILGSLAGYYGGYSVVSGLLIFVAIITWLIFGLLALVEYRLPQHYVRIGAIVAYAVSIVFWLAAWAWSAFVASVWLGGRSSFAHKEGGVLAACASLGAATWILSIVHFFFFLRACLADAPPVDQELGEVLVQKEQAV